MSAIRSKNTKPEVFLRKQLFRLGYRYRLHSKHVTGTPDLFMRKYNTAIFINGCFWHRHPGCRHAYTPKSNTEFWEKKFSANVERDKRQKTLLQEQGIRILIIWECTIKKMMKNSAFCEETLERISRFLNDERCSYLDL